MGWKKALLSPGPKGVRASACVQTASRGAVRRSPDLETILTGERGCAKKTRECDDAWVCKFKIGACFPSNTNRRVFRSLCRPFGPLGKQCFCFCLDKTWIFRQQLEQSRWRFCCFLAFLLLAEEEGAFITFQNARMGMFSTLSSKESNMFLLKIKKSLQA